MSPTLKPDAEAIGSFVNALFRYAEDGSFVSLRAFDQRDDGKPPVLIRPVRISGSGFAEVIETAIRCERDLANRAQASVFCPPIATFHDRNKASEAALANGLVISVELDKSNTAEARQKLEGLLGQATVVVASGGTWKDPQTGAVSPKLHIHWRLSEPTTEPAEHAKLKRARHLACILVGADPTAKTPVHPLRWPGTWHRKAEPPMARIVAVSEAAEVHLPDALDALEAAVEAAGISEFGTAGPKASGEPQAPIALLASALEAIPNDDAHWDDWTIIGLLLYRATGTSEEGLQLWIAWSWKSPKHRDGACEERWAHFATHPPTRGGAGTIFMRAKAAGWTRPKSETKSKAEDSESWPAPFDFLAEDDLTGTPELKPEHLPDAISPFVFDSADRMGADLAAIALAALVSLASVTSDDWRVQPKQFDTEWTEQPRTWGAMVGDPSIRKTPIFRVATSPIDRLEAEARARHTEAMKKYKVALKQWKNDQDADPETEPKQPKLDRYVVESTTVEALSEILRDDEESKQRAPARKVLVRQDELGELLANFDRYNAGGRGGGDRGAFLRLYNGGRHVVDRITRGSFACSNWSACLLGGIQPEPIQRIASQAADDGLLQRFMFCVVTDHKREQDRPPNDAAIRRYKALFPALAALHPARSPGSDLPQRVVFHCDAHRHRLKIAELAEAVAGLPDTSARLKSALGKWPGLFARLALIFHLVGVADDRAFGAMDTPTVITEATAARVAAYMRDILLPHLIRAERLLFATAQTGHAKWIAGYILAKGIETLALRDVVQDYGALRAPERRKELIEVLGGLETFGWLRPMPAPTNSSHPTRWAVNPAVHTAFASRATAERKARAETKRKIAETVAQRRASNVAA